MFTSSYTNTKIAYPEFWSENKKHRKKFIVQSRDVYCGLYKVDYERCAKLLL